MIQAVSQTLTPTNLTGPQSSPREVSSLWSCSSLPLFIQGVSTTSQATTLPTWPEGALNYKLEICWLGRWTLRWGRVVWGHTRVVLVLPYFQSHQVLALPQNLHGILHGAAVQADIVDGQQLITWLKGASPA